ncbi:hypothetical protein ET495_04105 [Xylanimonas allomyrinae]|uniref:Uncharacterized protein n=1 Tax=Xylanimonas allomyrinae TaxID=2509459 RepID=A0A4P6EJN0_9MICO|nr:hypothetical protein [Xylanimonas allomyrinae]QAY62565.1 hypothetical protein ET495_04105 [Xylanimonas allomyrinae]
MSFVVELRRWVRTRRLFVLCAVFLFSGMTSPLLAYYSGEIFRSLGASENITVIVGEASWQSLVSSYFKNSSQLALLLAAYLVGWACAIGPDDRLRLYYRSRVPGAWQVYGARLGVAGIGVAAAGVVGAVVAAYVTLVLNTAADVTTLALALAVQSVGIIMFATFAGVIACWTNAPFVSAVLVAAVVLVAGLFSAANGLMAWSPTTLLSPDGLLSGDSITSVARPFLVGCLVLAAGVMSTATIPWKGRTGR